MIFKQFWHFLIQNYLFFQKKTIFSKIWYHKRIIWLISIPEMFTFMAKTFHTEYKLK